MRYEPIHHTIVAMDVVASGGRDDQLLLRLRRDLRGLVDEALRRQSIDPDLLDRTDLGDGLRLAVPATVSAAALLDPFVPTLDAALREHRKAASEAARLRIRMVAHQGLVHRDGGVWAGAPLVVCARLLDSGPLRQVLAALPDANLALAVSESIHDSLVRPGYGLDPATYQRVPIRVKETDTTAWIHVPGHRPPYPVDASPGVGPAPGTPPPDGPPGPTADPPPTADPLPTAGPTSGGPPGTGPITQRIGGHAQVGAQIGVVHGTVHIGRTRTTGRGADLAAQVRDLHARLTAARLSGALDDDTLADARAELDTALAGLTSTDTTRTRSAVRALRKLTGLVGDVAGLGPLLADLMTTAEDTMNGRAS